MNLSDRPNEPAKRRMEAVLALEEAEDLIAIGQVLEEFEDIRAELCQQLEMEAALKGRSMAEYRHLIRGGDLLTKYRLVKVVGRGGQGIVYRALDRTLGRIVAVKVFAPRTITLQGVRRFVEEPQLAGHLDHPGVNPIYELGRTPDGRPAVAMKWVDGHTLDEILPTLSAPEDRPKLIQLFKGICQTVAFAHHERGIIHRDLKPENVMVGAFGEILVMDWGLARALFDGLAVTSEPDEESPSVADRLTQMGQGMGTLPYMSPEQARGELDRIDQRTDVFALGAILCEMLTGVSPYWSNDANSLRREHLYVRVCNGDLVEARVRLTASGADAELLQLAEECLEVDPERRPEHAGEVLQRVTAYLDDLNAQAQRREIENATLRSRISKFRAWVLTGAVLALSLVLGVVGWLLYEHEQELDREKRHARLQAVAEDARRGLSDVDTALGKGDWGTARESLQRVQGRLEEGGRDAFQEQILAAQRDLDFIQKWEALRQHRAYRSDGIAFDNVGTSSGYARLFREYGVDLSKGDSTITAILNSRLRPHLMAALDHWIMCDPFPTTRLELLTIAWEVSRRANDPWGMRFHDRRVRRDLAALTRLADEFSPAQRGAVELESLAMAIAQVGGDPESLLRRGLTLYTQDFWLNLLLAQTLEVKATQDDAPDNRGLEDAAGYARAAVVLRPDLAYPREVLGRVLLRCGRDNEGIDQLRKATAMAPRVSSAYYTLAQGLMHQGRYQEARNTCDDGLRIGRDQAKFEALRQQIERLAQNP